MHTSSHALTVVLQSDVSLHLFSVDNQMLLNMLVISRAAVGASQHFTETNDAFCDGAFMMIFIFLFVCWKVYTRIITFTPTVLSLVTFQGLPRCFIFISTCQHGLIDTESSHRPWNHFVPTLYYCCSEFIFHFAFLFSCMRAFCVAVTQENSMNWSLWIIEAQLASNKSHKSCLGPCSPYYKVI